MIEGEFQEMIGVLTGTTGSTCSPRHWTWIIGKPKHHGINKIKAVRNLRSVAEERVGAKFTNMRVLNSYWINQDATFKYFEV